MQSACQPDEPGQPQLHNCPQLGELGTVSSSIQPAEAKALWIIIDKKKPFLRRGLLFAWEEDAPEELYIPRASSWNLLADNLLKKAEATL